MNMNFGKPLGFWNFAEQAPDKVALVDPQGREWSRGELLHRCNQIVHGFRAMGLEPGDSIAALLPNCAEYVALNLAVTQAGFYLVPLNWHLAAPEVAYILKDSNAKAFVCDESVADTAIEAIKAVNFPREGVVTLGKIEGYNTFENLIAGQSGATPLDRRAGMVMFYTSGTTGKPKGVRRAMMQVDPDMAATMMTMLLMLFGIEPEGGNVHFCGSPLYHTAVMNWSSSSLHYGHTVVLHENWDAEKMLHAVEHYQITTAHVVPTQMVRLHKLPAEIRAAYKVSSMRHMLHTAAPCPPDVKLDIIDWWGPCVYEYYASTEGGGTLVNSEDWLKYPGTVGRPWPTADIKIFDDQGHEKPAGEQGTIYMLMSELSRFEYKGDKEKTEKDRFGDYFTAGDIGYLNDQGFLFLCDRKIDMIISGGANIYPAEIENILITHPSVADCSVFGIPNDEWGEEVKAAVQLTPTVQQSAQLHDEILAYCAERLAKMKLPKSIDYMEALPRDPNGKLYKRKLRDPYWAGRDRQV